MVEWITLIDYGGELGSRWAQSAGYEEGVRGGRLLGEFAAAERAFMRPSKNASIVTSGNPGPQKKEHN